jgi:hypothetical protein
LQREKGGALPPSSTNKIKRKGIIMELTSLQWVVVCTGIICCLVITIFAMKGMNEDGLFDKIKRSKRILIRVALLIFSPIIVPLNFIAYVFYFLFGWLIKILFE